MPSCAAQGCSARSDKGEVLKIFPRKDLRRRQIWTERVNRPEWTPTKYSALCEVRLLRRKKLVYLNVFLPFHRSLSSNAHLPTVEACSAIFLHLYSSKLAVETMFVSTSLPLNYDLVHFGFMKQHETCYG